MIKLWSALITDESQEMKEKKSHISPRNNLDKNNLLGTSQIVPSYERAILEDSDNRLFLFNDDSLENEKEFFNALKRNFA